MPLDTPEILGDLELAAKLEFPAGTATKVRDLARKNAPYTPSVSQRELDGKKLQIERLLETLGFQPYKNVEEARNYIVNRLIELSASKDEKSALRALELLGKHHDIGLFTERSEVHVHRTTSVDIEASIRERIRRISHAETVDITHVAVGTTQPLIPPAALVGKADKSAVDRLLDGLEK